MQISRFDITDDDRKEAILEILGDKYYRMILGNIMQSSMTALQISLAAHIPATTVYRKLERLYFVGLVRVTGKITENGKKNFLYQSKVSAINTSFAKDGVNIVLVF
ncbi:MAG: helix-turn-helix domain-containing protein [Thermoproteota archaeon]|jgi:predicted transcriptional regulator|nr:helix-turn-helix domain-containing protein [Candidatus Nitrosotenuis sp.]